MGRPDLDNVALAVATSGEPSADDGHGLIGG